MRNKFLAFVFSGAAALFFLNGCDKKEKWGGCLIPRSVYSRGISVALSFINKDSTNLLTTKALQTEDIELKYGTTAANTIPLYQGDDQTALKYIAFLEPGNVGDNNLTITVKGTLHTLSFNEKLVAGHSCTGPDIDLSNFKLDNKAIEPAIRAEDIYVRGNKVHATFLKVYIVL